MFEAAIESVSDQRLRLYDFFEWFVVVYRFIFTATKSVFRTDTTFSHLFFFSLSIIICSFAQLTVIIYRILVSLLCSWMLLLLLLLLEFVLKDLLISGDSDLMHSQSVCIRNWSVPGFILLQCFCQAFRINEKTFRLICDWVSGELLCYLLINCVAYLKWHLNWLILDYKSDTLCNLWF